ncbi:MULTISPECIES: hypothetical protein [Haloferax]|uniref:AlkP-core domain protein n=1 Tax=Haloferax marinum TaxID=2666143 RepID=A0A6A8G976_9EURY|nr:MULTISPECIES: hypothetical protein [Haloferax]KAB1198507.1 hypothetical protein Hfx1150_13680 [Haloferax sp. CBA1150]MRW97614.1 hypothetical protein [Haloferax marinum]
MTLLPDRYTLDNFTAGLRNPKLFQIELRRMLTYQLFTAAHGRGISVTEQDWDTLVILDACRYDYFADRVEQSGIDGSLSSVISRGPESWIFMSENFVGNELHDTVYVSANPHANELPDGTFFRVEPLLDSWDPDAETILPDDVVSAAVDMHERHPDKRLIVHFMQPHIPYIGETAEQVRRDVDISRFRVGSRWWDAMEAGEISREQTHEAYVESLDIVLEHVASLLEQVDGKTVITADHGELLGERLVPFGPPHYGHPPIHTAKLRTVPWFEPEFDDRREVVAEDPMAVERLDDEEVGDRLEALGYV